VAGPENKRFLNVSFSSFWECVLAAYFSHLKMASDTYLSEKAFNQ
jgi:hypothetical protein